MEYTATSKYVRISPRKARMVAALVKKLPVAVAQNRLELLARSGAEPILKTLNSAIANSKLALEELTIKNLLVDEGVRMKRQDTSHRPGRGGIIQKRTSHITVVLTNLPNKSN